MKQDTQGQVSVSSSSKAAVAMIIGIAVAGILAAFLLPVAVNEIEGNETFTTTQDTQSPNESVNAVLDANLTGATTGSPDTATIELNNNGTTESNTIDNGTETAYTSLPDGDATVGVEDVNSGNATFNVTYSRDYAYSDGASTVWGLLGLALVLGALVYLLKMALGGMGRGS